MSSKAQSYDLIADGFARLRDSFNTEQKYVDQLMGYLVPGAHVLDMGCGSGYPIAAYLLQHGFRVTGIDVSEKLLAIARANCPELTTICADVRDVILPEQYDAIIEWWCLFHLPKQDHLMMLERFASWLKPGGILEFTTGDHEYEGTSQDMLDYELAFYSLMPDVYRQCLKTLNFEILLCDQDQEQHLVWIARKLS